MTQRQRILFFRTFAQACVRRGIPPAEREAYRHNLIAHACPISGGSLRNVGAGEDFDRLMRLVAREAQSVEAAGHFATAEARRLAKLCEALVWQIWQIDCGLPEALKGKSAAVEEAKKAEKSIGTDHPFTPMGNDEFECLFNALDRDNDVEFRLLFTPLAQQNMVDLLEDPEPYGDDFNFYKRKKINVIASTHSQSFDYSADPENFIGYDGAEMKQRFVTYCDSFIKSLFFDLAPLLSIPLYQMHKSRDYIYKNTYPRNITSFEQEALANGLSPETFRPATADPTVPSILKVRQLEKEGKSDLVEVEATAFETYRMVDYVPVMGGDGRSHNVPVPWIRYEPVSKITPMAIKEVGKDRYGIGELIKNNQGLKNFLTQFHYRYERGLLAFASDSLQSVDDQSLSGYFADKDSK